MDFVDLARQYFHSNELVPVPDVVSAVLAGDTGSWNSGVTLASRIATAQDAVGQDLTTVLGRLESTWSGAGADGAAEKMQHIRGSAVSASQTFQHNSGELGNTASLYESMKHQLTPMPPRPNLAPGQSPAWWDLDTEDAVSSYNDAAKRNLDIYRSYANQVQAGSGDLKSDYGQIGKYDGGDVTLAPAANPAKHPSEGTRTSAAPGGAPSAGTNSAQTAPPSAPGGGALQPSANEAVQPSDAGGTMTSGPTGPGTGNAAANVGSDPTSRPGTPGSGGAWFGTPEPDNGGPGTTRFGNRNNPGTTRFGKPGSPNTTRFGEPEGGFAKKLSGEPGGINRFGAGNESGGASRRLESGSAKVGEGERVAGRNGTPGAMAPGGRGGKKGEDEKHERKYVLDEDVLFEGDSRPVDPETGLPPVPPTIGA
ncbi:MAG TPA: hypothetical protein VG674_11680 [Amycolatopsis sp.]|nr:hypothetical protein [Amycolatopsis sp.]